MPKPQANNELSRVLGIILHESTQNEKGKLAMATATAERTAKKQTPRDPRLGMSLIPRFTQAQVTEIGKKNDFKGQYVIAAAVAAFGQLPVSEQQKAIAAAKSYYAEYEVEPTANGTQA